MKNIAFVLSLLLFVSAGSAQANDSTGYLATGGLVLTRTADIEMREEELYVSEAEIRVRYHFFNTSANDIKTLVAFPIPDLRLAMENDYNLPTSDPVNFIGFETKVNGRPVTNGFEQRAQVHGADHTDLLKSLNVPLLPDTQGKTKERLDALSQEQKQKLLTLGLVTEDINGASDGNERELLPNWTLKTTFHWEQNFPAQKELVVEHRYHPFVGGNVGYLTDGNGGFNKEILSEYKSQYCVDNEFLNATKRASRKAGGPGNLIPELKLEYVLTTGANWAGPIKDFRLVVDKGKPGNLVSFCATGVKKIAPTQFEVRYQNYTPDHNLRVLILQAAQ